MPDQPNNNNSDNNNMNNNNPPNNNDPPNNHNLFQENVANLQYAYNNQANIIPVPVTNFHVVQANRQQLVQAMQNHRVIFSELGQDGVLQVYDNPMNPQMGANNQNQNNQGTQWSLIYLKFINSSFSLSF